MTMATDIDFHHGHRYSLWCPPGTAVQLLTHLPMDLPWTQAIWRTNITGSWLSHPSEKYEFVSWGYSSQYIYIYGKIKHVPNHQPDKSRFLYAYLSLSNFLVFQGQGRIIPFFTGTSLVEARDVVTVGQTEIFELRNPLPWNNAGPEGQVRQQTCGGT